MFPPFPQELAHHYCLELISRIEKGDVELFQIAKESLERKNQGVMIGSLVCWNKNTNKRVVLYSVSGNAKELKSNFDYNFVPSIVPQEKINEALKENDLLIHQLTDKINSLENNNPEKQELIQQRTKLTDISLQKVFDLYKFTCFDGNKITLNEIIKKHGGKLPPTGTGDCCAPKLLSYAFENNLEPLSMDEVYFGKDTRNKQNGVSYSPCDERCGYIFPYILGLEILYRDKDIVVVNKPSGLLSVPGRGEEKIDSVETRLKKLIPECINQPAVHRLDMETSGILVLALNKNSHRILSEQFAEGKVQKKYTALLDGILHGKTSGHIELKFRLDVENRPYQIYDEINGKLAITDWKKTGVVNGKTKIEFEPKTGRTHQLRLAASSKYGLGLPIFGDSLYGKCLPGERLMLHAFEIAFFHPVSNKVMHFICKSDF